MRRGRQEYFYGNVGASTEAECFRTRDGSWSLPVALCTSTDRSSFSTSSTDISEKIQTIPLSSQGPWKEGKCVGTLQVCDNISKYIT